MLFWARDQEPHGSLPEADARDAGAAYKPKRIPGAGSRMKTSVFIPLLLASAVLAAPAPAPVAAPNPIPMLPKNFKFGNSGPSTPVTTEPPKKLTFSDIFGGAQTFVQDVTVPQIYLAEAHNLAYQLKKYPKPAVDSDIPSLSAYAYKKALNSGLDTRKNILNDVQTAIDEGGDGNVHEDLLKALEIVQVTLEAEGLHFKEDGEVEVEEEEEEEGNAGFGFGDPFVVDDEQGSEEGSKSEED